MSTVSVTLPPTESGLIDDATTVQYPDATAEVDGTTQMLYIRRGEHIIAEFRPGHYVGYEVIEDEATPDGEPPELEG